MMNEKRMIFHLPFQIDIERPSASQIRPIIMIEMFKKIGYKVDLIMGNGKSRKKLIRQIKKQIESGVKYAFLYSENSTMPTLLTEKSHMPIFPRLDFSFFRFCKKNNIRIGLFYRDIHWQFPWYYQLNGIKGYLAKLFYLYDLRKYNSLVDILFLPSIHMAKYLKFITGCKIATLPPGMNLNSLHLNNIKEKDKLKIFYVGGIGAHYSMIELFSCIYSSRDFILTVCCRKYEWLKIKGIYEPYINENIKIIHNQGLEMIDYLKEADICSLFIEPNEYWSFAMPLKLFDYISYNKPVIATKGTAVGDFIKENDIGWEIDYNKISLRDQLLQLKQKKSEIIKKALNIQKVADHNTWEFRAIQVETSLSK